MSEKGDLLIQEKANDLENMTWDDLVFLSSQNWGLRHVNNLDIGQQEIRKGIKNGDALSLSSIQNLIPPEAFEKINMHGLPQKTLSFAKVAPFIPNSFKDQIVSTFSISVIGFIKDSVARDLNSANPNAATSQILDSLTAEKFGFIVAKFNGASTPRDVDKQGYYGLGKCGNQTVEPENMVALFDLRDDKPDIVKRVEFTNTDQDTQLSIEKFDKIKGVCSQKIWEKIVNASRKRI